MFEKICGTLLSSHGRKAEMSEATQNLELDGKPSRDVRKNSKAKSTASSAYPFIAQEERTLLYTTPVQNLGANPFAKTQKGNKIVNVHKTDFFCNAGQETIRNKRTKFVSGSVRIGNC